MIYRYFTRLTAALRSIPRRAWFSYLLLCVLFGWLFLRRLFKENDWKSALHIYLGSWLYVKLGFLLPMRIFTAMCGDGFFLLQHMVLYAYGVYIAALALRWLEKNEYISKA